MIVVLDTNVWVSAFLSPRSTPGRILGLARIDVLQVVSSPRLWAELSNALNYERVRGPLQRDGLWDEAQHFLRYHPKVGFVTAVEPTNDWLPNDPDDNWVVQCALTAGADRIVTGDKAVRALDAVEAVKVVTPRELLDEVGIGTA